MPDSSAFRYTGDVVDSERRTWDVNHDHTLSAGAEGDPLTPVVVTSCGERDAANAVAREPLSDTEYLVLFRMQQEAERHTREGNGEG